MTRQVWQIRLSAEEDAAFRRLAAEAGTDRAGFFRRRVLGQGLGPRPLRSAVEVVARVSGKASGSGEGQASSRAPTAQQLAGRNRVPVAVAARWLASGEWEKHWQ